MPSEPDRASGDTTGPYETGCDDDHGLEVPEIIETI